MSIISQNSSSVQQKWDMLGNQRNDNKMTDEISTSLN